MIDTCLYSLSKDTISQILPASIRLMIDQIGLGKTIALVDKLGGTTLPIPKRSDFDSDVRYFMLVEVVGIDAANLLTAHHERVSLYIPRCHALLVALRNHQICAEFDQMTCRHTNSPQAVSTLARKHRLSDRWIWKILSNPCLLPSTYSAQPSLF